MKRSELVKFPYSGCGFDEYGDLFFIFENKARAGSDIDEIFDKDKISLYSDIVNMETLGDLEDFIKKYGRLCPDSERDVFGYEMLGYEEEPTLSIWPLGKLSEAGYEPAITPKTTLEELDTLGFSKRLSEDELAQIRDGFRERKSTPGNTLIACAQADNFDAVEYFEPEVQVYSFPTMFEHLVKIKSYVSALLAYKEAWNADDAAILCDAEKYISEYIKGIFSFSKEDGFFVHADYSLGLICYFIGRDIDKGNKFTTCKFCGKFIKYRTHKEYCSDICRTKGFRKKKHNESEVYRMFGVCKMPPEQIAMNLDMGTEEVKWILKEATNIQEGKK